MLCPLFFSRHWQAKLLDLSQEKFPQFGAARETPETHSEQDCNACIRGLRVEENI